MKVLLRSFSASLVLILALTSCRAGPATEALPYEVVRTLPHDTAAFTQGLLFHRGLFYESTGIYGQSTLREVDPDSGRVLRKRALPRDHFGEGLALHANRLYQLTWREGVVWVYDADTLETVGSLPLQGQGWGLAAWNDHLILSDGSDTLRVYDPATWQVVRTVAVRDAGRPVDRLNELEMIDSELWANIWGETRIARIDPESGVVRGWLDLSALVPAALRGSREAVLNGIAYDPETRRIFITGKYWPVIHELKLEK